jgi:hypothetical protein
MQEKWEEVRDMEMWLPVVKGYLYIMEMDRKRRKKISEEMEIVEELQAI